MAKDVVFRLGEVPEPEDHLRTLLDLWRQGQERPIPFFPDTSWEFAAGAAKGQPPDTLRTRCEGTLKNDYNQRAEGFHACVATAFRGRDPLDDDFRRIARAVFHPILQATGARAKRTPTTTGASHTSPSENRTEQRSPTERTPRARRKPPQT
ncbi:hypothetical protein SAMN02745206_01687 [Desulfacinum infernum DSM 9756]|uniref:RecC C-terminal domain-containing protein n=1 Tax=Desulfacinum infernum DSM 9756 TaxID=1121391 RepID=A0A1M5AFR4_9BACT|nr:hypothetical protein SAMN02745206_01687 [Desulfacinum infernum DSM 9756]